MRSERARHNKIIFSGTVGAGKSTAIAALSDIPPVATEAVATDETSQLKKTTTVAMDYGVLNLPDGEKVMLYGTPGQERFSFMWDILSEGGIDFQHPTPLPADTHLAVKLVLMPQALGLLLRARVTHCDPKGDGFDVGTEFESMTDAQRQLLARYILQKQAQERRLAREQSEDL